MANVGAYLDVSILLCYTKILAVILGSGHWSFSFDFLSSSSDVGVDITPNQILIFFIEVADSLLIEESIRIVRENTPLHLINTSLKPTDNWSFIVFLFVECKLRLLRFGCNPSFFVSFEVANDVRRTILFWN